MAPRRSLRTQLPPIEPEANSATSPQSSHAPSGSRRTSSSMSRQRNERLDRTNDLLERLIEQMAQQKETTPAPLNQQAPPPDFSRNPPPVPPSPASEQVHTRGPAVTYLEFLSYRPQSFKGTTVYTEAEEWLKSIEATFAYINKEIPDVDKVRLATSMFKDDARIW